MPESTFLSLFEGKLLIDDKQLLAINLLSQNMQSEFQQAKNNFENPNTVLSRDKKKRHKLIEYLTLSFCLNMQHSTL